MKTLHIDLPGEIDSELESLGLTDDLGLAEWVTDAIRQKLAAAKQLRYLEERAARGSKAEFARVLAKVPAVEPAEEDRW